MTIDPRSLLQKQPQPCPMAIASMIFGLVGVVLCIIGPVFGLPAVILGHLSLRRIRNAEGALLGRNYALTGLIAGYAGIAMGLVFSVFVFTTIRPGEIRLRASEARIICLSNLTKIEFAKDQYAAETGRTTGWTFENDQDAFNSMMQRGYLAEFPMCPASASSATGMIRAVSDYFINPMGVNVECRIAPIEHRLPARK